MISWWQWGILALVPPAIILLYFLKLKRQPLLVPSTYLWQRSIEDLHVNSIWQKLRQNLLLFLQLLLLLLAMLALLRPSWQGSRLSGERFIFLIDNSASMNAGDVEESRLAEAKQKVGELVEEMESGDVGMIVSFADGARVVQSFTDNRRVLRERLESVAPTTRTTTLDEALRVAAGLANPGRSSTRGDEQDVQVADALPATVYIYSDGKFADVEGFSLGNLNAEYRPIGSENTPNVGITAFDARRNEEKPEELQAFARIENFSDEQVQLTAELYLDNFSGLPIDAARITIPAAKQDSPSGVGGVEFRLGDTQEGKLMLKLDVEDALQLDNRAYAVINPPQRGRVMFVSHGNTAFELALDTDDAHKIADIQISDPRVLDSEDFQREATDGKYNLIIYDRCRPPVNDDSSQPLAKMPQGNTFFIGTIPPVAGWEAMPRADLPQIIDYERAHPLLQLLDLGDVHFLDGRPLVLPLGGRTLIDTTEGPIFAIAPRGGFEDAVLGVEFVGERDGEMIPLTDWTRRISFPVFVLNLLHYLGGGQDALSTGSVRPGRPVELRSELQVDVLDVHSPEGNRFRVQRDGTGRFNFGQTDDLGVYEVFADGTLVQRIAVNLFDASESNIRPRMAMTIGHTEIAGIAAPQPARKDIWKLLLLLALGVLFLEWYIYNRRVYL